MSTGETRREFLKHCSATVAGAALASEPLLAAMNNPPRPGARVAVARDDALSQGRLAGHGDLLRKLLDAAMQKITGAPDAPAAWRTCFTPDQRVGIKVNTLGLPTQPTVVDAIVAGLTSAGIPAANIVIWDRFDVELSRAGFRLRKSGHGVQCRGTDAERIGSGYQREVESHGRIGSCFSRIVATQVDALISVPVLKDHNLAGASLGMKNFYGAIHNPNKYHDHNCDPYIVDVVSHRFIAPKWRLTVCDGTRAQYHAGPGRHPGFVWPFSGLIVSRDFVAADAVAADIIDAQRKSVGFDTLAEDKRPTRYIATAGARGLGEADLDRIERLEV